MRIVKAIVENETYVLKPALTANVSLKCILHCSETWLDSEHRSSHQIYRICLNVKVCVWYRDRTPTTLRTIQRLHLKYRTSKQRTCRWWEVSRDSTQGVWIRRDEVFDSMMSYLRLRWIWNVRVERCEAFVWYCIVRSTIRVPFSCTVEESVSSIQTTLFLCLW